MKSKIVLFALFLFTCTAYSQKQNKVNSIINYENFIYVSIDSEVYKYNTSGVLVEKINQNTISNVKFFRKCFTELYAGTTRGLYRILRGKWELVLPSYDINDICFDEKGTTLWVATSTGIGKYYFVGKQIEYVDKINDVKVRFEPFTKIEKFDNKMYFSTFENGLFELVNDKWKHYTKENGLPFNTIHTLALNSLKTKLWIGSSEFIIGTGKGLAVFDTEAFKHFQHNNGEEAKSIYDIKFIDNQMYLGSSDGFYQFINDKFIKLANLNSVTTIEKINKTTLWIGTFYDGLYEYNLSTKKIKKIR